MTFQKSQKLIKWIEEMNMSMNVPSFISEISMNDIHTMAKRACIEANPFYPVPEIWSISQFENVFTKLEGEKNA